VALFDVFVTGSDLGWPVSAVSSSPAREGVLIVGVNAADSGTAAKEVGKTIGQEVSEAWRVWPAAEEAVVGSPAEAT
jgi:hypothetical protein